MQEHELNERKWYLATKVLTSGLNADERAEWEALKNDLAFQQEFTLVEKYWQKMDTLPYQQINAEKDWKLVWDTIRQQVPVRGQRTAIPWLRYAAVFLVCMAISFFIGARFSGILSNSDNTAQLTTIEAPAGSKTYITLPDSSHVWLNAKSKITFNKDFGAENRHLKLEGEAFFDVVKKKVPFRVETPLYTVAVLGTAFNIKAYSDDDRATTTLVRGLINIERTAKAGKTEVTPLKPNEKLIASRTSNGGIAFAGEYTFQVERGVDAAMETAWKDGWLSVQGESLNELAKKIERLYDIKINFQDEELQRYRYTGRLRQLSLEQVLKALSLTSPIEFTIAEKTVTLRENQSTKSKYNSLQVP
jgi:ferric-dicitrate binding protein FerR (iron transport regulator)